MIDNQFIVIFSRFYQLSLQAQYPQHSYKFNEHIAPNKTSHLNKLKPINTSMTVCHQPTALSMEVVFLAVVQVAVLVQLTPATLVMTIRTIPVIQTMPVFR